MANQFFRNRSPRELFEPVFNSGTLVSVEDDEGNSVLSIKPFEDNGLSASDFSIKSQLQYQEKCLERHREQLYQ